MQTTLPERPSRRAATRRRVVVEEEDSSDVENASTSRIKTEDDEEEEYTQASAKATRASPRRRTIASQATTPRKRETATRRTRASESVEPSQIFSPPESVAEEPLSPTKKSPPKRRSVRDARAARKSRVSRVSIAPDALDEPSALPTPHASVSPEPQSRQATPLADITESALNEQSSFSVATSTPKAVSRHEASVLNEQAPSITADSTPKAVAPRAFIPADEALETDAVQATPKADVKMEVKKVDPTVTKLEKPMDIMIKTRALGAPQPHEPAVPATRMTITYLILNNFKSYAGRQEVGPFHASFSSVIGPNGSGKSNVIDSLLFVFGFRASKMRQGKLSALIHNSAQHPDLDFCEVEVRFQEVIDQPSGCSTVVPDSQLVISRRAFKNNSSSYYINGRTSNFTAVTTLLKGKGIDLDHKRFLILQGEVESIAQMKPKAMGENDDGLLEYLEDIIGTSKYKTPIDEAAAETEALNEVCLEKNTRVQHVEKEKNGLEDKKDKALAYIRDENELALKQSALYQVYVAECDDNIQVTEEACAEIQAQLDTELQKHQGSEDGIKQLEKQYKAGSRELEKLDKDAQSLVKEMAKLDKETVKFEEKRKFLANKAKKLEKTVEGSNFAIGQSATLAKNAEDDVTRLAAEIDALEREMTAEDRELAQIRDRLKGKTQGLSDDIAAKQKKLEPWSAKINERESAIAVAQSELDILRERESSGATAVAEAEGKINALQEKRVTRSSELEDCKTQRKAAEKEAAQVQKQLEQLASQETSLKSKLSNSRQKADEARASLSATQSQGNVLAGLNRLKESGRIDGFHGRLGNLGAIDQKYDVAISTACPQLDNLVVDSVEVGQQCLEYLRKNNLGRATIICLKQLAHRDASPKPTPENAPRLFDLVKSKHERFLPAFYSVLQDTLVATDLEQANRIAYGAKRWRVVTLDGQLIDKSGTMTGGGTRVMKGGMSAKLAADTTKEQVARLELDRDALEKESAQLQEAQRELHSRLRELHAALPRLETQAQKLALELDSVDRDIADCRKRVRELAAEAQPSKADKSKIAQLEKTILQMQKEVEKLQAETAGIEEEIKDLQDKIMEIGGVQLRSQKAKVDGLRTQVASLNETMSAAEVSKTKAEKQQIKQQKTVDEAAKDLAKVQAELEQVDEEASTQNRDNSGLRKQAEEAQQALEYKKEELLELKAQLDAQMAELNETRGIEVEMRNKLEENKTILADSVKRLKYWQDKLSKLALQNIGEDGEEREPQPLPELSRDELEDQDKEELKASIAALEERTSQHVELAVRTDDLRRLRLEGFMEGFSTISLRLKEMYQMITMGGNAELELVDSLDPFAEGILFSVMPPKKSWKNISNLSGGEKTLSSLALVFALHHYKPTPLYVMDEIDAALDFRNVSIVAAYIKERTKNAQFIVISLRNNMFELASRLVGVYKVNHMTKSVAIENKDYITASA